MKNKNKHNNKDIKHLQDALNYHGDIFRGKVKHTLNTLYKESKIDLELENEEYELRDGSSIDLIYSQTSQLNIFPNHLLLIECKKLYPEKCELVFIEDNKKDFKPEIFKKTNNANTTLHKLYGQHPNLNRVIEGYKYDSSKKAHKALNKDFIYNLTKQISHSTEMFSHDLNTLGEQDKEILLIPIIITNAKLQVIKDIKYDNVKLPSSILKSKDFNREESNFVLLKNRPFLNKKLENIYDIRKISDYGIFIVNIEKFKDFNDKMINLLL
jgi:hypothetical protein